MVEAFRVTIARGGSRNTGALFGVRPRVLCQAGLGLPGKMMGAGEAGWSLTVVHLGAWGP